MLRAADGAPAYDEAEAARIQAEHLAHHDRLRESGLVVTNGPVRDQADVTLRDWPSTGPGLWRKHASWRRPTPRCAPGGWQSRSSTGTAARHDGQPGRAITI